MKQIPWDVLAELHKFRAINGRCWKSRLCLLWEQGRDVDNPLLRQARNMLGPSGLYKIDLLCCHEAAQEEREEAKVS